jgi:hypothetical protein
MEAIEAKLAHSKGKTGPELLRATEEELIRMAAAMAE